MSLLSGRQRETWPWWGLPGSVPHEERWWNRQQQQLSRKWRRRRRWWKCGRKFQSVLGAFLVGSQPARRWGPLPASVHGLGGVSDRKWNGQHAQQQQLQLSSDPLSEPPVGRSKPELPVPATLVPAWLFILITFLLFLAIAHRFGGGPAPEPWWERLCARWVHLCRPLLFLPRPVEADSKIFKKDSASIKVCSYQLKTVISWIRVL